MKSALPSVPQSGVEFAASRRLVLKGAGALALSSLLSRAGVNQASAQDDSLPSWNDGAAKQAVLDFVAAAIDEGNDGFVPPADRIATFDQDGTLWVEHPIYGQAVFAIDRVKALAPDHPDWATTAPFDAILNDDQQAMEAFSEQDWEEIIGATHAGMTGEDFQTSNTTSCSKVRGSKPSPVQSSPSGRPASFNIDQVVDHVKAVIAKNAGN